MDRSTEEDDAKKFVCKFCSKRFSCGRSLGGHIRTHMNSEKLVESSSSEEEAHVSERDFGFESGYRLRENPRKTQRFVDEREIALKQWFRCKECGKGFDSRKALCGHMTSHSEKEKIATDDQSDIEENSAPNRRKRSKKVVLNGSFGNSASSVSEIEQEENETAAMGLMMLSKDLGSRKLSLSCFGESSSDNNSIVMEAKTFSGDPRISAHNTVEFMQTPDADEMLEIKEQRTGAAALSSDNSDSGYFRNGPKKTESEVSVDEFNEGRELDKSEAEFVSNKKRSDKIAAVAGTKKHFAGDGGNETSTKRGLRKRSRSEFRTTDYTESIVAGHGSGENKYKSLEDESCVDPRTAVLRHDKIESCGSKKPAAAPSKKFSSKKQSKEHVCPVCFKVFKSGQAMGGHKRSHFFGNQEKIAVVIREETTQKSSLIDLNLPAPADDE